MTANPESTHKCYQDKDFIDIGPLDSYTNVPGVEIS